jgi:hypothetical protein
VTFNAQRLAEFTPAGQGGGFDLGHPNAENVLNLRSDADVVSRWDRHIGKACDVPGAGRHGINAFIDRLNASPMGGWKT